MEKKQYDYFVSFYFETKKREYGWGNTHLISDRKITNYGIIKELSDKIKEDEDFYTVVITNYILLK